MVSSMTAIRRIVSARAALFLFAFAVEIEHINIVKGFHQTLNE